jgi:hypothetical protein
VAFDSSLISGSDQLTSIFGYWPSFHDAEVLDIILSREPPSCDSPTLRARIHVHEMTRETDDRGYFVTRHHSITEFLFRGVEALKVEFFNHQNALQQLAITIEGDRFLVDFESAYGVEASFSCSAIELVSVTPEIPPGSVYSKAGV